LRSLHILFVDNDTNGYGKILQALDDRFVVDHVTSLAEAKRFLETSLPDVIISEVLIGKESGLDLCQAIRKSSSLCHVPIMLLTSHTTLQDKIAGFSVGADDYVVKPFDAHHLMARIRLLARIKRLELNSEP